MGFEGNRPKLYICLSVFNGADDAPFHSEVRVTYSNRKQSTGRARQSVN